ncbi:hypothetical protein CCH79_00000087 [Gambusia affinis]|uniref:Uncharacterized protein n=1 Tax=Gambusia affinis TaxID=33528 RepID=A0A315VVY8_GAMAF|nr:hypothetical protein CCH79_00000087 [Gambusia affinis]
MPQTCHPTSWCYAAPQTKIASVTSRQSGQADTGWQSLAQRAIHKSSDSRTAEGEEGQHNKKGQLNRSHGFFDLNNYLMIYGLQIPWGIPMTQHKGQGVFVTHQNGRDNGDRTQKNTTYFHEYKPCGKVKIVEAPNTNKRDRVRSSVIWKGLRVEPLLLQLDRSQLRWLGHLVRMPPGRLPGEAPGKTQDTLEGLCFSAGLGMPWDSPGGAGRSGWGEGSLGLPSEAATPTTRPRESGRKWMDGATCSLRLAASAEPGVAQSKVCLQGSSALQKRISGESYETEIPPVGYTSVTVHCPSGLRERRLRPELDGMPLGGTLVGWFSLSGLCVRLRRSSDSPLLSLSSSSSSLSLLPDADSYVCSSPSPSSPSPSGWLISS